MHLHCQFAVEMNPEIADCGLGSNCMVAEMNVIDANLRKLLSTTQPDELRFLRIQLQAVRGHPSVDLFNAGSNFVDHPNGFCGLVEDVDLFIISIAMDTKTMLVYIYYSFIQLAISGTSAV